MKKYLSVLAAALLVAGIGCKMDSDVMATYDGGKITRGRIRRLVFKPRPFRKTRIQNSSISDKQNQ